MRSMDAINGCDQWMRSMDAINGWEVVLPCFKYKREINRNGIFAVKNERIFANILPTNFCKYSNDLIKTSPEDGFNECVYAQMRRVILMKG
jgi:hypothetical protein